MRSVYVLSLVVAIALGGGYNLLANLGLDSVPEDAHFTPEQLCEKYGYPFETHNVTTDDGYILTLFRIKHGKEAKKADKVVFLQHCLLCSAHGFLAAGPEKALAYRMADAGYDVWMGNSRGSYFSRAHISKSPEQAAYWDFTWAEMGRYDVPANINYVK